MMSSTPHAVWATIDDQSLAQGDYLPGCEVPLYRDAANLEDICLAGLDLIVMTQSCDLAHGKTELVTLCPIWTVQEFESAQRIKPASKRAWRNRWNNVRKGREARLHLLRSPTEPDDLLATLVVDFKQTYSLPFDYLTLRASELTLRWRLQSPYLEHFSQAFARFFMRVGLPSSVPEFK